MGDRAIQAAERDVDRGIHDRAIRAAEGGLDRRRHDELRRMRPNVSVVVPTLNEAANIPHVLSRLPADIHEVIVVDGHSTDSTIDVVRSVRPDARVILTDRRGKGAALTAGWTRFRAVRQLWHAVGDCPPWTNPWTNRGISGGCRGLLHRGKCPLRSYAKRVRIPPFVARS